MRELAVGCLDGSHSHRVLAKRKALDPNEDGDIDWYVTVWLCPVLHSVGLLLEDVRGTGPDSPPQDPRSGTEPSGRRGGRR